MIIERRRAQRSKRTKRLVAGAGVGVPAAGVITWLLSLRGIIMPPGVEASVGALIGVIMLCMEDISSILLEWMKKKLRQA